MSVCVADSPTDVVERTAGELSAEGVYPSVRRIAGRAGLSVAWVQVQVARLRGRGRWPFGQSVGGRPSKGGAGAGRPPSPYMEARARWAEKVSSLVMPTARELAAEGLHPSVRRIAERIGCSSAMVARDVRRLRSAGSWEFRVSRPGAPRGPRGMNRAGVGTCAAILAAAEAMRAEGVDPTAAIVARRIGKSASSVSTWVKKLRADGRWDFPDGGVFGVGTCAAILAAAEAMRAEGVVPTISLVARRIGRPFASVQYWVRKLRPVGRWDFPDGRSFNGGERTRQGDATREAILAASREMVASGVGVNISEIARRIGRTRQCVDCHVAKLRRAGLWDFPRLGGDPGGVPGRGEDDDDLPGGHRLMAATRFSAPRYRGGGTTSPVPTPRSMELFLWLFERTDRDGFQPSVREVLDHFGLVSTHAVRPFLDQLRRHGWVDYAKGQGRAVRFRKNPDGSPFAGFGAWALKRSGEGVASDG